MGDGRTYLGYLLPSGYRHELGYYEGPTGYGLYSSNRPKQSCNRICTSVGPSQRRLCMNNCRRSWPSRQSHQIFGYPAPDVYGYPAPTVYGLAIGRRRHSRELQEVLDQLE